MRLYLLFIFVWLTQIVTSQTISGRILNPHGQPLQNVHVLCLQKGEGTFTDETGMFNFSIKANGEIEMKVSHISFKSKFIRLSNLKNDTLLADISLEMNQWLSEELIIKGLRSSSQAPITQTTISSEDLSKENLAQDVPFLLRNSPSVIVSSDAGNGVGYSSMRIRGTDQSRINVTINGIPYNVAESQQVFWVDLPDFTSSVKDIQIQRGLGSSTHGSGAFGGSLHFNSLSIDPDAYIQFDNSFGSYNTHKHSLSLNSGTLGNYWNLVGRLSLVKSDGYVDRASSDLKSYYLKASYVNSNTAIHLTHFSGKEKTYQSWYGTPEARVMDDLAGMQAFTDRNFLSEQESTRLLKADRRYNFYQYENQIDDYRQDHYSLHLNKYIKEELQISAALHYTKGKGFFEEFKTDDELQNYLLGPVIVNGEPIYSSDLIRKRWLDNDFYGGIINTNYNINDQSEWILGAGFHKYIGTHFGELIDVEISEAIELPKEYYRSASTKTDFNFYSKLNHTWADKWNTYLDVQIRKVNYKTIGNDNDLKNFDIDKSFIFFNPKIGLQLQYDTYQSIYAYIGLGHREPDRNDFIDQFPIKEPESEQLLDIELGYQYKKANFGADLGLYWMNYKNQLVLSGDLNDVGAPLRINVSDSYRLGFEASINWSINSYLRYFGNLNISSNKIKNFEEVLYDYSQDIPVLVTNYYKKTNISFSPDFVVSMGIQANFGSSISASLIHKYVSKQFLDNTSNPGRSLGSYIVGDLNIQFNPSIKKLKNVGFTLQLNNIWNRLYSSNGYTYSYIYGDLITENFLYPQAERNFMLGLSIKF